ncbi:MAG TPA: Gfo/Idh/MocA family oxidoreductase [Planctomicrobium sp.]|nr:Gfo/Idh/MocA family oxidoreductase [Planctomicrobium sp.]
MSARPFQVVVVGVGSIGERHLRCFLATERAQVRFVELNPALLKAVNERYPQTRPFSSLEEALTEPCDVAVIATPAPSHLSIALQCVQRGVHVLIEKPLSVKLDGIDELLAAVDQSGVIAGTAYVYRALPALAEFRKELQSGRIGKPVQLVATCGQNFPTYRPAYAQTYYAKRESGGGAVQDALTHILNVGEWLLGPIDRLVADADHLVLSDVDVEDTVHVLARHAKVMASYTLNQHQAPNEIVITVAGEQGTLRYENHIARWRVMEKPDTPWIDSTPIVMDRDGPFIRQANAFLDAVSGNTAPLCSLREGLSTLLVNRAILQSAESQTWVSINTVV